jgi:hypothetical protein
MADRGVRDEGIREARARFGGLDVPASLVGMLAALATLVILGGIAGAAAGGFGYQRGVDLEALEIGAVNEVTIGGLVAGLVLLFLAFMLGGWAAGRMARYSGSTNGMMTAVWAVGLAALMSALGWALGREYDVFANVQLPQWFSTEALGIEAIVTGIVAIGVMLIAGALGGILGERYHRAADAVIVDPPVYDEAPADDARREDVRRRDVRRDESRADADRRVRRDEETAHDYDRGARSDDGRYEEATHERRPSRPGD